MHQPKTFISRGQLKPCPEIPKRAEILLSATKSAGHKIANPETFGLEPVGRVHDQDYLHFLANAWRMWSELPDYAPEIIPNVHPGRNMDTRPKAVVGLAGYY